MNFETITNSSNNEQENGSNKLDRVPSFSEHVAKLNTSENIENNSEKSRIRETFAEIDEMYDITYDDKFSLVGVVEDIKPAGELFVYITKENAKRETEYFMELLDNLGLVFIEYISDCEYDPNLLEVTYYVSKSEDLAKEVVKQFNERISDTTGAADRKLGQLFGFPETATEWYIEQAKSRNEIENVPGYDFYIHSPEHAKEEYEQYEAKIMPFFEKYCPISAEEIKNPRS